MIRSGGVFLQSFCFRTYIFVLRSLPKLCKFICSTKQNNTNFWIVWLTIPAIQYWDLCVVYSSVISSSATLNWAVRATCFQWASDTAGFSMRLSGTAFALFVPLLVNAGSDFDSECPPNPWVDVGCEVNPHVCQITCNTTSVCTATPAASPCSVGNGTAPMDAAKCEQFCKDSWEVRGAENEDVCRFWRFVS